MNPFPRLIGQIPYGVTQAQVLPGEGALRGHVVAGYLLEVIGNIVCPAAITLRDGAPMKVIRNVSLVANNTGIAPQSWEGESLYVHNMYMGGTLPDRFSPALGIATNPFLFVLYYPLEYELSGNPELTYLDTKNLTSLNFKISWGDSTDIVATGAGSTIEAATTFINVYEIGFENRPEQILGFGGSDLVVQRIITDFPAVLSDVNIPLNNQLTTRALMIRQCDSATGFVLSDTRVTGLRVKLNTSKPIFEMNWNALRHLNQRDYRLAEAYETPASGFSVEGFARIDFVRKGPSDAVTPIPTQPFGLFVDIATAGTRLEVYQIMVR